MILKQSQIKETREQMLKESDHICPLCGFSLSKEEAVLDHDHETGFIRGAVHGSCNVLLGKIENAIKFRAKMPIERYVGFTRNLSQYISDDYRENQTHPAHKKKMCNKFKKMNATVQWQYLYGVSEFLNNDKKIDFLSRLNKSKNQTDRVKLFNEVIGSLG